ncbi:MAG: response regulator transcription factor [Verrucomicrobia bacterium]|nr:response regulator transcription factor [Verrucomicrobiota bacterium]
MPITVAIVEDKQDIREGVAYLIRNSPGFDCIAAFGTGEEALRELPLLKPDVVLMDIQLPRASGIHCLRRLKPQMPRTQFMMLTVFEDPDRIFESLNAGASGYLVKKTPPVKLLESIGELHAGGSPMSNQIARRVVEAFHKAPANDPAAELSDREREILNALMKGRLYKEIANGFGISTETVRTHIHRIYEKLHVRSRAEAVQKIMQK